MSMKTLIHYLKSANVQFDPDTWITIDADGWCASHIQPPVKGKTMWDSPKKKYMFKVDMGYYYWDQSLTKWG